MDEDGMTVEDDPTNQSTGSSCADSKQKTVIKLCIVQPKSLQELDHLFFLFSIIFTNFEFIRIASSTTRIID